MVELSFEGWMRCCVGDVLWVSDVLSFQCYGWVFYGDVLVTSSSEKHLSPHHFATSYNKAIEKKTQRLNTALQQYGSRKPSYAVKSKQVLMLMLLFGFFLVPLLLFFLKLLLTMLLFEAFSFFLTRFTLLASLPS